MGRPSEYSEQLADKICERIACSDLGLEEVLQEISLTDGWAPHPSTVYRWLDDIPEFRDKSARARTFQSDYITDLAVKVARTPLIGRVEKTTQGEKSETQITVADNVERAKLIVQTLFKRAGQLNPKKYGERITNELTGADGGPLQIATRIAAARERLKKAE
jgi:hypothetical protein